MSDAAVKRLMNVAIKQPETQALMDYLDSQNAVPKMATTLPGGENTYGRFTPKFNFLQLAPSAVESDLLHELVHAGQFAMAKQAAGGKSNQFTEAYKKLVGADPVSGESITTLVDKLDPKAATQMSSYRKSPPELQAFGVADSVYPDQKVDVIRPPGNHVNTTLATEFMILLDLANRNSKPKPSSR